MRLFLMLFMLICLENGNYATAQTIEEPDTVVETEKKSPDSEITENSDVAPQNIIDESEIEVMPVVFPPEFMSSLRRCNLDSIVEDTGYELKIAGMEKGICRLEYADFVINVPQTVLDNIHGFDDVRILLKNKEFARYNYQPEYDYNGLIYAFGACLDNKEYMGDEKELSNEEVVITSSLSAEIIDDKCIIALNNQLDVEGSITDYGVTCKLSKKVMEELKEYFADIIEKYGEKRVFGPDGKIQVIQPQQNKKTHDADIALMYYMQQKGYCRKNSQ